MFKKVVLFIAVVGTLSLTAGVVSAEERDCRAESGSVQKTIVNINECGLVNCQSDNSANIVDNLLNSNFISRKDKDKEYKKFPEAKQVREKYRPQMLQIKASIKELRGRMAKELTSNNPNKAVVKNYVNQIVELRRKQQILLVDQMFETLEQLPKEKRVDYIQPIVEHCLR